MEEAFRAILVADSGVSDLVSTRVYFGQAPESAAKPYIVASRIGGSPDYNLAGPSGLENGRLQVECWAGTYGEAKALCRAARAAVSGYRGTVDGLTVQGIFIDVERDGMAEDPAGALSFHRVFFDVSIWFC